MKNISFFTIILLLSGIGRSFSQTATATGTVTNIHCHGDSTGSIAYHITGGPAPVHYVWNTGDSGVSVGGCTYTVHIDNPGAPLSNYQLKVNLPHANGMTANFSNVVFTDSLSNPIPFWLQDFPTASAAIFWVKVPVIPTGGSIIYLSFCGSATTSIGSAASVFEFFDNFDNGTFGSWTHACVTPMAGSSCAASASNTVYFSPGYSAYLSASSTCFTPPYSGAASTISHTVNPIVNDSLVIDYNDKSGATLYGFCSGGTSSSNTVFADNVNLGNGQVQGQGGSCNTALSGWASETSHPFLVTTGQTTIKLQTYGGDCDNSQGWFDNVRIRKYLANPPTIVIDTTPQLFLNHLAAGTYTITMTAANGTVSSSIFVVTQPTAIAPQLDSAQVTCYGFSNGEAWISGLGGTPHYTYLWSTSQTTDTITNLSAGTYQVTVTDSLGCRDSAAVMVRQPSAVLSGVTDSVNVFCKGQGTGQAWVTAAGGTPGYSYLWSNTQTTDTISHLTPGLYSVVITDSLRCTVAVAVNITEPANPLTVRIDSTNVRCKGGSTGTAWAIVSGGTAGYTYLWSTAQSIDTITTLAAAPYEVTVTDTLGCTASVGVNITEPADTLSAIVDSDNISCKGYTDGKAWVTANGGTAAYSYLWSNTQTGDTIRNLSAGHYTVQVLDANACSVTASVNIVSSSDTVIIDSAVVAATCGMSNGSITVTPSGGSTPYSYRWSTGSTEQTLSAIPGGTYTVTITDLSNCSSSRSVSLIQFPALTDTVIVQADTCKQSVGGASVAVLAGTPPYIYAWSNGIVLSHIDAISAGTYDVTITDSTGCSISTSSIVPNTDILPNPTFGATDTPICNGSVIKLDPGTFTSYAWQDGSTSPTFTVVNTGTYSVTVTNNYGCQNTALIRVNNQCTSVVLLPTGFSPNNDGVNDLFHPIYTSDLSSYHISIYDRWGVLVFESSDYTTGWDGTYRNVAQPIGTYTWFASYAFSDGKSNSQSGNITLIR